MRFRSVSAKRGSFENRGTTPLEFVVAGIAHDMSKKNDKLATPPQRRGM